LLLRSEPDPAATPAPLCRFSTASRTHSELHFSPYRGFGGGLVTHGAIVLLLGTYNNKIMLGTKCRKVVGAQTRGPMSTDEIEPASIHWSQSNAFAASICSLPTSPANAQWLLRISRSALLPVLPNFSSAAQSLCCGIWACYCFSIPTPISLAVHYLADTPSLTLSRA
jgi:hypothetical protein